MEFSFFGSAIKCRELLVDLAHGLNIEAAVVHELRPLLRVRLACRTIEFPCGGERLAENLNESAAVGVFSLVFREMEYLAEFFQRTGETCLIGQACRKSE